MIRNDKRLFDELRKITITPNINDNCHGSCLISFNNTKVICTATVEEKVPAFLRNQHKGWVTAEYSMLPTATKVRTDREAVKGKQNGRTLEIQRLIGRTLRASVDLVLLGERQIKIDCDVIKADGGTRTASITGGFVALYLALEKLYEKKLIKQIPVKSFVAAVSSGIVNSEVLLDLDYEEDSSADTDSNFVMNEAGQIIEIQSSSEKEFFSLEEFNKMLELATKGINEIIAIQKQAILDAKNK